MKLVVGQPVFERAWCLPLWFDCLEAQQLADKKDITLCFAYSKSFDGTYDILRRRGEEYGDLYIAEFDLPTFSGRENVARFSPLAQYRNALLEMVKEVDPEYFLSWDNDIIFPPKHLQTLYDYASPDVAVGALIDMGGRDGVMAHPSVMEFGRVEGEHSFRRPWQEYPQTTGFECDIIMAVKLMGRDVYRNTHYKWDVIGEDIGWSKVCKEKGYKRYLQPLAHGIHLYDKDGAIRVMKEYNLDYPDIYPYLRDWYL